jgi:Na+-transporting methylmalonyl-CoA/oxaloacetate decarboxylase gamma subunit
LKGCLVTQLQRILLALLLAPSSLLFAQQSGLTHAEEVAGGRYELGLLLMILGMGSVFCGLLAIYGFLIVLRNITNRKQPVGVEESADGFVTKPIEISAEMAHAIALALYMDLRTFDEGTAEEVTIRKITRPFSPWWNAGKTQIMYDKIEMFRRK